MDHSFRSAFRGASLATPRAPIDFSRNTRESMLFRLRPPSIPHNRAIQTPPATATGWRCRHLARPLGQWVDVQVLRELGEHPAHRGEWGLLLARRCRQVVRVELVDVGEVAQAIEEVLRGCLLLGRGARETGVE